MDYSLHTHALGYSLKMTEAFSLLTTTALPYALRHRELAQTQKNNWLGHQVLFIAECIPVIGLLVAAIEYLVASYFRSPVPNKPLAEGASSENTPLAERAILYMSITGNPTHLGHMAAIATAIDVLVKKGTIVEKALISLSADDYHKTKVANAPGKFALSQEAREHLLQGAIAEAGRLEMFQNVPVEFWNDQDLGSSDHPESYRRLAAESEAPVFFVAGFDLCKSMGNWINSVKNAIVIFRNEDNHQIDQLPAANPSLIRLFSESQYPQFKDLSSSDIQKGKAQLVPVELQQYFEAARAVN